jgi:hypothetical protein
MQNGSASVMLLVSAGVHHSPVYVVSSYTGHVKVDHKINIWYVLLVCAEVETPSMRLQQNSTNKHSE